jgi:hypothetical protein
MIKVRLQNLFKAVLMFYSYINLRNHSFIQITIIILDDILCLKEICYLSKQGERLQMVDERITLNYHHIL